MNRCKHCGRVTHYVLKTRLKPSQLKKYYVYSRYEKCDYCNKYYFHEEDKISPETLKKSLRFTVAEELF